MDRYIGIDVHTMSCTLTIVGLSGRKLKSDVVETNGQALVESYEQSPRPRHLCFEEDAQSAWLHEILSPHVEELWSSRFRATEPSPRAQREAFVERILSGLTVLPFDLAVAHVHARVVPDLGAKGAPVGAHDLIITATATATGYLLATRDDRSFPKIPGVSRLRW